MINDNFYYRKLSDKILDCAFTVHNTLQGGLPEKLYQNALMLELHHQNINAESEVAKTVYYRNKPVGIFKADIIVDNKIILELKSVDRLHSQHYHQLLNYLKITGLKVGYLLNFYNQSLEHKRLIL